MYLYLNPVKEKIPIFLPLFAKRIWGSNLLYDCRYVSRTSDREPNAKTRSLPTLQPEHLRGDHSSPSEPIRLGICRLASGKLQVVSSASNQGFQERGSRSWSKTNLIQRRGSSLMCATASEPSSLIVFENAENGSEDKNASTCSLNTDINCNRAEQSSNTDHEELPLLFSLGKSNYEEALNTIGAARDAGSLCQSAATQLKDICHHLHMEDAIRAAAKPCELDRVDDIIIRKKYSHIGTYKQHDYSLFIQAGNSGKQSVSPKVNSEKPNPSDANLPRHVTPGYQHSSPLKADKSSSQQVESLSVLSGKVGITSCNGEMLPLLQCVGENEEKAGDPASSDGPSKEQLFYMHHRLSEEMPRFFEQSHDYGLYADTVYFDNRIMKVRTRGLSAYKATVQSLKYLSTACLTNSQMEVLRITMETEQHLIQARWRIKGVPLHSYILRPWGKKHKYRYFDAFSTFHVGSDGLIHSHVLDKVMPSSEGKVVPASWAVRLGIMMGLLRPPSFEPDIMKAITHMKSLLGK